MKLYTVTAKSQTGERPVAGFTNITNLTEACIERDQLNNRARINGTFHTTWYIVTVSQTVSA